MAGAAEAARATARLLADLPVGDLTIEDPAIEDVIEHVFAQETAKQSGAGTGA